MTSSSNNRILKNLVASKIQPDSPRSESSVSDSSLSDLDSPTFSDSDDEDILPKALPSYNNHETFLNRESVTDIAEDDLLILDNYAFSIEELKEHGERNNDNFFKNPHENSPPFSEEAKKVLENHPDLKEYAQRHNNQMTNQAKGISNDTLQAVTNMLLEISKNGIQGKTDPRVAFLEYKSSLQPIEQTQIDDFIIKILHQDQKKLATNYTRGEANFALARPASFPLFKRESKNSPQQNERIMKFSEALVGGNQSSPCVRTLQIFLWQFVINLSPAAEKLIPGDVKLMAHKDGYILGSKENVSRKKYSPSLEIVDERHQKHLKS